VFVTYATCRFIIHRSLSYYKPVTVHQLLSLNKEVIAFTSYGCEKSLLNLRREYKLIYKYKKASCPGKYPNLTKKDEVSEKFRINQQDELPDLCKLFDAFEDMPPRRILQAGQVVQMAKIGHFAHFC
jgi:hypothetical protein